MADRQEGEAAESKSTRQDDKIASLREQMRKLTAWKPLCAPRPSPSATVGLYASFRGATSKS
jgi:hypothetical protein